MTVRRAARTPSERYQQPHESFQSNTWVLRAVGGGAGVRRGGGAVRGFWPGLNVQLLLRLHAELNLSYNSTTWCEFGPVLPVHGGKTSAFGLGFVFVRNHLQALAGWSLGEEKTHTHHTQQKLSVMGWIVDLVLLRRASVSSTPPCWEQKTKLWLEKRGWRSSRSHFCVHHHYYHRH